MRPLLSAHIRLPSSPSIPKNRSLVLRLLAGLDGALQGETLVLLQLGLLSLLRDVTLLLRLLDSVTVGLVVLVVVGVVLGLGHFSEVCLCGGETVFVMWMR